MADIQYTAAETAEIREKIKGLISKVKDQENAEGFAGGVYCGYLRALNDIAGIWIDVDIRKTVAAANQAVEDLREIRRILKVRYGIDVPEEGARTI